MIQFLDRTLKIPDTVILMGGHYTSMIECGGRWYHYDDIGFSRMKLVGTHEDVWDYRNGFVLRNCTNVAYV